jgi:hypothetical protein
MACDDPVVRYADCVLTQHWCYDVFGVIRTSVLKKTPGIGNYFAADLVLLSELAITGKLHVVTKPLFLSRDHQQRSVHIPIHQRAREWWPKPGRRATFVYPYWKLLVEHILTVNRATLNWNDKYGCYKVIFMWYRKHWRFLGGDIKIVLRQIFHGNDGIPSPVDQPQ